jgi:hypothetical protein
MIVAHVNSKGESIIKHYDSLDDLAKDLAKQDKNMFMWMLINGRIR